MTQQEKRDYSAKKNAIFKANKKSGQWPSDHCPSCAKIRRYCVRCNQYVNGCCMSYSHHIGDCCTHCGNDERDGGWTFR